jgi:predicted HTH transcriptional regulator
MTDLDLFINAVEEKPLTKQRRISENSINAYHSKEVQLKIGTQKERIYSALKKLGKASDRMLATTANVPLSQIADRRQKLLESGLIKKIGKATDPVTSKEVDFYAVA